MARDINYKTRFPCRWGLQLPEFPSSQPPELDWQPCADLPTHHVSRSGPEPAVAAGKLGARAATLIAATWVRIHRSRKCASTFISAAVSEHVTPRGPVRALAKPQAGWDNKSSKNGMGSLIASKLLGREDGATAMPDRNMV